MLEIRIQDKIVKTNNLPRNNWQKFIPRISLLPEFIFRMYLFLATSKQLIVVEMPYLISQI